MTSASAEDNVLINAGEAVGTAAGKAVATVRRTVASISDRREKLADVAAQAKAEARDVYKKTRRETKKAVKSAKRVGTSAKKVAASAKRSVKRVARKIKRS